jgi:hypothetical protein
MRGVFVFGLVLGGCFAPAPQAGGPCSPQGTCPSPFDCVEGFCQQPGTMQGDGALPEAPLDDAATPDAPFVDATIVDGMLVCPTGFTSNAFGSCHRSFNNNMEWPQAEAMCESFGAHLAVIETQAEAMSLPGPAWVGISDRVTEGTFRSVTGPVIAFTFWASGEPSGGNQSCVHTSGVNDARWRDGPCTFPFGFVCEYDGTPADPTAF